MKFDELFNKVMNKLEVVNEDAEDVYDPESAGEPTEDLFDKIAKGSTNIEKLADEQPIQIAPTEQESLGVEEDPSLVDKGFAELDKIQADKLETEKENKINDLISKIKQSESDISRLRIIQTKASDPKKPNSSLLNQCAQLLQDEIQKLELFKNELNVLKPKKVKTDSTDVSKTKESEKDEEKETKKEEKDSEKKEDKEESKKEEKESEKKEDKEEKKNESVEQTGDVLTEAKKSIGTEFYLTELN